MCPLSNKKIELSPTPYLIKGFLRPLVVSYLQSNTGLFDTPSRLEGGYQGRGNVVVLGHGLTPILTFNELYYIGRYKLQPLQSTRLAQAMLSFLNTKRNQFFPYPLRQLLLLNQ